MNLQTSTEETTEQSQSPEESGVRTTQHSQAVTAKAVITTADDPTWYKDAIIYQLHIKAYFDANDDGIGDFKGLISKLDYIESLGVTALWLLPFYPSPLRDDGYDISDYRNINPSYGDMADFKAFVKEAHRRGLRVISELVVNHTSDQHPWFQRARRAKKGSRYRNYYVWSDTDQKYSGTRIIFLDTEKSNWTWDPVAEQYYWHRFYSHQPDLNFDNPEVVQAILKTMRFWLDLGVDGLRLDAVPYLCEREGTNNENLAETHEILKLLRAEIDTHYKGRLLLAEANQWPEDVLPYFGQGDECHMAFHFPLMPRLYMAVAQEDRHPITDIMRQTPDLPEGCQWAIFLRNHDELTLEMVTDQERDYLWQYYANDKRMRINLGIRRRLAPLMENNRPKIDLLNSIVLSMPGTPVLYYGDEIGMGDNVYLGDRDGVRTPMQWSLDRNGGFSRADPARLYLPTIQDPVHGYQAVNVEAQTRSSSSLLNYMRRMISARRGFKAFGRGTLTFLYPNNRKVLAYMRAYEDELVLCIVNLSRTAQPVELDLSRYRGKIPVELIGRTNFPAIGERPYPLTLQSYNFFWFVLLDPSQIEGTSAPLDTASLPDFVTLVTPKGGNDLLDGRPSTELQQSILPQFIPNQRWFGAKDRQINDVKILGGAPIQANAAGKASNEEYLFTVVETSFTTGEPQRYALPLSFLWCPAGSEARNAVLPQTIAHLRRGRAEGALFDAAGKPGITLALLEALNEEHSMSFGKLGELKFTKTSAFTRFPVPEKLEVRGLGAEQSNSSTLIEDYAVLKIYRRLVSGIHPEVEISRYLADKTSFDGTPPLLGTIEWVDTEGNKIALGSLAAFARNQGDAWSLTLDYLRRSFDDLYNGPNHSDTTDEPHDVHGFFVSLATTLGRRTAELHRALCPSQEDDLAFAPEPIEASDMKAWAAAIHREVDEIFGTLTSKLSSGLDDTTEPMLRQLVGRRQTILKQIDAAGKLRPKAMKTRFHGDYHLGQVLVVQNDFAIIDFEGEPRKSIEERRRKYTALKDVAGMIRSIDYAAAAAARTGADLPEADRESMAKFCADWRDRVTEAFLKGYRDTIAGSPVWPDDDSTAQQLLDLLVLEKAFYEIGYELANRPGWLSIPVEGALRLSDGAK